MCSLVPLEQHFIGGQKHGSHFLWLFSQPGCFCPGPTHTVSCLEAAGTLLLAELLFLGWASPSAREGFWQLGPAARCLGTVLWLFGLQHRADLGARERDGFKESGGCRSPSASAGLLEPCVLPARSGRDRAVQRQEAGEQRGVRRAARLSPGRLR